MNNNDKISMTLTRQEWVAIIFTIAHTRDLSLISLSTLQQIEKQLVKPLTEKQGTRQ